MKNRTWDVIGLPACARKLLTGDINMLFQDAFLILSLRMKTEALFLSLQSGKLPSRRLKTQAFIQGMAGKEGGNA